MRAASSVWYQSGGWRKASFQEISFQSGRVLSSHLSSDFLGFHPSLPFRKFSVENAVASASVSWCDQGTRAVGLAPFPVDLYSARNAVFSRSGSQWFHPSGRTCP